MARPVKTVNKMVCPDCDTEFTGKTCPECGTTKELKPLAADGIPRDMHKPKLIFGDVSQLSTSSDLLDDDNALLRERAEYQQAETHDNLRESLVLKSKIKNMELKKEMLERKIELDRYKIDPVSGPAKDWPVAVPVNQQHPEQPGQQSQSLFGPVSPQASFMSQLMKMDKDKRGDFLEQLTDADPTALQTLSGMFQPSSMTNPQMNPQMMNMQYPPWMNPMLMQQQQQPQEPAGDPMIAAVEMMATMFTMFKEMQPKSDNSANERMVDFKNSLEKLNDKLDTRLSEKSSDVNDSLRSELHEIKARLSQGQKQASFSDNVKNVREIITDLESIGLINQSGTQDTTIDDKLKLQQANHDIDMENKRFELEKDKMSVEEQSANTKKDIVSAMMKGRMQKRFSDNVNEAQTQQPQARPIITQKQVLRQKPKHIFSEVQTEAGTIQETRKPIATE